MPVPRDDTAVVAQRTGRMASLWRYALALTISAVVWGAPLASASDRAPDAAMTWFLWGDPILGVLSFVLIRWRHRHPAAVALALTAVGCVSTASAGPASWIVGSLASHRRWRLLAAITPLSVLS